MPEGKGLFLDITHRIHPSITKFTSEIFYEDKLTSLPELENQQIVGGTPFDGAGLFYVPVDHIGNQNRSPEEADTIAAIVENLLEQGEWLDREQHKMKLTAQDILIVAPYNAQVSALIERMPGMRIGTVDKFQGQEAPVVIYSTTSSSHEEAPRGMNFLYNPNRLNVATSRAKCICVLVASPRLMEPDCRTIDQMKWANALCRVQGIGHGSACEQVILCQPSARSGSFGGLNAAFENFSSMFGVHFLYLFKPAFLLCCENLRSLSKRRSRFNAHLRFAD